VLEINWFDISFEMTSLGEFVSKFKNLQTITVSLVGWDSEDTSIRDAEIEVILRDDSKNKFGVSTVNMVEVRFENCIHKDEMIQLFSKLCVHIGMFSPTCQFLEC